MPPTFLILPVDQLPKDVIPWAVGVKEAGFLSGARDPSECHTAVVDVRFLAEDLAHIFVPVTVVALIPQSIRSRVLLDVL